MAANDFFNGYTSYKNDSSADAPPSPEKDTVKAGQTTETEHPALPNNNSKQIQEARYVGEKPRPFPALLIASSIMGIFLLVQLAVSLPFYSEIMFEALEKAGNDEALAMEYYMASITNSMINTKVLLVTTSFSLVGAAVWYYFQYCRKNRFSDIKETCKTVFTLHTSVGLLIGTIALFFLSGIVGTLVMNIFPAKAEEYEQLISMGLADLQSPLVFFIIVILAPINEECIFRGLILTKLKKNMKPFWAILFAAVLFGVFHMNLIQVIYVIPVGAALAYMAWKYQSIIPSLIMHALYNAMNYVMDALPASLTESNLFVFAVLLVSAVGWYFLELRRRVERKKPDIDYNI